MPWKRGTACQQSHYDAMACVLPIRPGGSAFGLLIADQDSVELLELNTQRWWAIPPLPSSTSKTSTTNNAANLTTANDPNDDNNNADEWLGLVTVDRQFYAVCSSAEQNNDDSAAWSLRVYCFHFFGGSNATSGKKDWELVAPPLPQQVPRCYAGIVVTNSTVLDHQDDEQEEEALPNGLSRKLLIVGGRDPSSFAALASVEALDLQSLQWSSLPPMPTARMAPAAVELPHMQQIWVIGGYQTSNQDGGNAEWLCSTEVLDTGTEEWKTGGFPADVPTPMPIPVAFPKAFLVSSSENKLRGEEEEEVETKYSLVVIGTSILPTSGGLVDRYTVLQSYDLASRVWYPLVTEYKRKPSTIVLPLEGSALTAYHNCLYSVGGRDAASKKPKHHVKQSKQFLQWKVLAPELVSKPNDVLINGGPPTSKRGRPLPPKPALSERSETSTHQSSVFTASTRHTQSTLNTQQRQQQRHHRTRNRGSSSRTGSRAGSRAGSRTGSRAGSRGTNQRGHRTHNRHHRHHKQHGNLQPPTLGQHYSPSKGSSKAHVPHDINVGENDSFVSSSARSLLSWQSDSIVSQLPSKNNQSGMHGVPPSQRRLRRISAIAEEEDDSVPIVELTEPMKWRDAQGLEGTYVGTVTKAHRQPHGKGRCKWAFNGDVYDGRWRHGIRQGHGRMTYKSGAVFEGWFEGDLKQGRGTMQWRDGRQYEGMFVQDQAEDMNGTMTWKNGTLFVGEFQLGRRTGKGVVRFPNSVGYQGEFVNGKYHGLGTCTFADGKVYTGYWRMGKAHGQGRLVNKDGSVIHDGTWRMDAPIADHGYD